MAPVNGSARSRRPGPAHSRQPSKSVVPAIPLPHVKRQAAAVAAASAASTVAAADTSSPDAPRSEKLVVPNGDSTIAGDGAPAVVSGSEQVAESGSAAHAKPSASPDLGAAPRDDAGTCGIL